MPYKGKVVKRVVRVLTDPRPNFVSLVQHGANQQPFLSVKMAKGETQAMPPALAQKASGPQAAIQSILFAGSEFADTEAVEKYLSDNGYEDVQVAKADNGFVAELAGADTFEGSIDEIPGDGGVTFKVGRLPESDDGAATKEDVTKAVHLFKAWSAIVKKSSEGTDDQLVKKGFWEIAALAEILQTLRWLAIDVCDYGNLSEDTQETLRTHTIGLVTVLGEMVTEAETDLNAFFDALTQRGVTTVSDDNKTAKDAVDTDKTQKDAKPADGTQAEPEGGATAKDADPNLNPGSNDGGQDGKPDGDGGTSAKDDNGGTPEGGTQADPEGGDTSTKGADPVMEMLKSIKTDVQGIQDRATKDSDEIKSVKESIDGITGRLEALESLATTRKGADNEPANGGTEADAAKRDAAFEARSRRNILGFGA